MRIIKIESCENGAHSNRNLPYETNVPDGWALIPNGFVLPESYPFVTLTVKDMNGVLTVAEMKAMSRPEVVRQAEQPTIKEQLAALQTALEDADALNVDQEFRLTLLELGIDAETFLI